ncbi:MAG TPA: general stress protein [Nocardioidaceae bacterium]|nr:general stress protein [Nocardioidaceae bacterium]
MWTATSAVDTLSDRGFPMERIRILGHGISTVETVTGRWTKGKTALAGAGTGAGSAS